MSEGDSSELFTAKHKRLWRIASIAKIFSWIILIYYIFLTVLSVLNFLNISGLRTIENVSTDFFKEAPLLAIQQTLNILKTFLTGSVFFLVLRAITFGLNMIIETDLNYRGKALEEEQ